MHMRKGEKMSNEMREKISQSRLGKGLGNTNGFKKGQPSANKGKKFSKEWRDKLSEAKKGKVSSFKGKKMSLESRDKIRTALRKHFTKQNPKYIPFEFDDRKKIHRERLKVNGGFHSVGEWELLKVQYNFTCPNCKIQEPKIKLTRDHIIAVSRGGSDNIENIQPLCVSCNSRKSTNNIRY